jgi:hypothetical protein
LDVLLLPTQKRDTSVTRGVRRTAEG